MGNWGSMENKNNKGQKLALTGGVAAALALKQVNPDVMAVYPITPQTPIIESYAKYQADGEVDTEIIQVESEHSAMSACVGASAAGARVVTATSSQGLALMNEILYIASGMRLPILMLVSARALSAPINIHGDHSDVMGARDSGWIQIFCANAQEVYDKTLIGLRLAEKMQLPVMVIMDGFNTSHLVENLEILEEKKVKQFVGNYKPSKCLLDVDHPVTFGSLALQNSYFEFKIDQEEVLNKAGKEYKKIVEEYAKISGRKYGLMEKYKTSDAQKILVLMGSAAGTAMEAIDYLRKKGEKVGLIRLELFRPFPYEGFRNVINRGASLKEIIILDRSQSIGSVPPLYSEIINSLAKEKKGKLQVTSYIYGLGGRDLFKEQIEKVLTGKVKSKYLS